MPRTSSSMPTTASPLQSPGHCCAIGGLDVGVGSALTGVTVGEIVGVRSGITVCVALADGVGLGVSSSVGVGCAEGLAVGVTVGVEVSMPPGVSVGTTSAV